MIQDSKEECNTELGQVRTISQGNAQWWIIASTFLVIAAFCGLRTPDVNESHYLTKAKHFWQPAWCADDLFLESSSAHWLFFSVFGWLPKIFSLAAMAWIGRVTVWLLVSVGWTGWLRKLGLPGWLIPVLAAGWLIAIESGNLAGEWVVGGFEAKSLAFALILFALGAHAANYHRWCWAWIGVATLFHFLVGVWFGLAWAASELMVVLFTPGTYHSESLVGETVLRRLVLFLRNRRVEFAQCFACAILAAIPSIVSDWNAPWELKQLAAEIQVKHRLAHHQYFGSFATERVAAFAVLIAIYVFVYVRTPKSFGLQQLFYFANVSLGISLIGLLLCSIAEAGNSPWAFGLLRFYWFRLADFALPTVAVVVSGRLIGERILNRSIAARLLRGSLALLMLAFGLMCYERQTAQIPRSELASAGLDVDSERKALEYHRNWLRVCDWISKNTDTKAVFITPAEQQTFKWYAGRSEIVCWKDMPQDSLNIAEWWSRVNQFIAPQRIYDGGLMAYSDEQLTGMAASVGATHLVILQRDYETRPTSSLKRLYPETVESRVTFVVLEF